MNYDVPNWNSWSSSPFPLNLSPESPMVDDSNHKVTSDKIQYGKEGQRQIPSEILWKAGRIVHEPLLAYENDEIFSWVDNYDIYKADSFEPDLYAYHPYPSCSPSPAPTLSMPITNKMIGQDVVASNFGGFTADPSSTQTTIAKLPTSRAPADDKRKAKEVLGDYSKEYTQMQEQGKPPTGRQRSAATHNLSERRRRDRINVQMRNIQDLIPSTNKLDKASVLQGTCEYIKSLKIQLQMFSLIGDIHQSMGIGFSGRFQMARFYKYPMNSSNIPGMLNVANLHSQAHKKAFARLCKQYLNLFETEFPRGAKPKLHRFADPQYHAQIGCLAQLCQRFLSFYEAGCKQAQGQESTDII